MDGKRQSDARIKTEDLQEDGKAKYCVWIRESNHLENAVEAVHKYLEPVC